MTEKILIQNKNGLHLRAVAQLVRIANNYPCAIEVKDRGRVTNAKSLLGLLALAIPKGVEVEIEAKGDHEEQALAAIRHLIQGRFGEAE